MTEKREKKVTMNVSVTPELLQVIDETAESLGMSRSAIVQGMLSTAFGLTKASSFITDAYQSAKKAKEMEATITGDDSLVVI